MPVIFFKLANQIVQGIHLAADHDLTLSASHDQLDHALCFAQGILIHLGFIFQGKAQPCKAVRQIDYIFFAADILHDRCGQSIVFVCHFAFPPVSDVSAARACEYNIQNISRFVNMTFIQRFCFFFAILHNFIGYLLASFLFDGPFPEQMLSAAVSV